MEDRITNAMYKYSHKDEVNGGETLHDSSFGFAAKEIIRTILIDVETDNEAAQRLYKKYELYRREQKKTTSNILLNFPNWLDKENQDE